MADVIGRAVIEIVPDFSLFRKEMSQTIQALTREMAQQLAKSDVAAPLAKSFGEAGKKASDNLLAATGKAFTEVAADASKAGEKVSSSLQDSARKSSAAFESVDKAVDFQKLMTAAYSAGDKVSSSMQESARKSSAAFDTVDKAVNFQKLMTAAYGTGEKVTAAFKESARQSSAALDTVSQAGAFQGLAAAASAVGEKVTGAFKEAGRQASTALRSVADGSAFTGLAAAASSAGEKVTGAFKEAGRQGQAALRAIGDSSTFQGLLAAAKAAGERITGEFKESARESERAMQQVDQAGKTGMGGFGKAAIGIGIATAGFYVLGGAIKESVEAANESARIGRITEAVIAATGGAANLSAKQIDDLAVSLSNKTGIDDEAIKSSSNVLLTFKNIKDQMGEGNDIFARTQKAVLDVSTVLGKDFAGSSVMLGKALNDPIKGMTALGKSGIQFTAEQKETIKGLVEAGDLLSAQKLILGEVEGQMGGAAAAAANPMERLKTVVDNLKESFGAGLLPIVTVFADVFSKLAETLGPVLQEVGTALGGALAPLMEAVGPILVTLGGSFAGLLEGITPGLEALAGAFAETFATLGPVITETFTTIGAVIGDLLPIFTPIIGILGNFAEAILPVLAQALYVIGDVIGNVLGPVLAVLGPLIAQLVSQLGDVLLDVVLALAPPFLTIAEVLGGALATALTVVAPFLQTLVSTFAEMITGFLPVLVPLLQSMAEAFGTLLTALLPLLPTIVELVTNIGANFLEAIMAILPVIIELVTAFATGLAPVLDGIKPLITAVGDVFEAITPFIPILADAMLQVALAVIEMLPSLMPLVDIMINLLNAIIPIIPQLAEMAVQAIVLLPPIVGLVAKLLEFEPLLYLIVGALAAYAAAQLLGNIANGAAAALFAAQNVAITIYSGLMKAAKVATAVWTGAQWLLNAALNANPIGLIVVAIAALVAGVVIAYKNFKPFRDIVDKIGDFFQNTLWPAIKKIADIIGGALMTAVDAIWPIFQKWFDIIKGLYLQPLIDAFNTLKKLFTGDFKGALEGIKNLFSNLGETFGKIGDLAGTLIGALMPALASVGSWLFTEGIPMLLGFIWDGLKMLPGMLLGLGQLLFDGLKLAFNFIVENGPMILATLWGWISGIGSSLIGLLGDLGGMLLGWLTTAFNWLVENGPGILATLWGWISGIPGMLLGLLGNLGGMLLGWLTAAFNWLVENGPGILATLLGWILTIPRMLVDGLLTLGGLLFDGVKIAFNFIVEKGPEVLATVLGWVTGIPGMLIGGLGAIGEQLFTWAKAGFDLVKEKGPELLTGLVDFFKGIPGKLVDALGGAATGAFNFAAKIFNALRGFINDKLINKLRNISVFGAKPFSGLPEVPDIPLAQGGIITTATNALIGEDGAEVVIPLTKPERAKELLVQSGLMNLISSGSPGIAMSAPPATPDASGVAATVTTAMSSVVDSAIVALQPIKDWFATLSTFAIDSLKTFGETVWAGVQVTFQFLATQILMLLESLTAYIALWPMTISALLANTGGLIWLSMAGGMGVFASSFKAVFADLSVYVTTWKTGLEAGFGALPAFMGGVAGQITTAVAAPFRSFATGIWNPFATTLTGALDQIPATANINIPSLSFPTAHSGGVIGGRLPETGGPFESSEMLVKMQRGEGVIPASVMKAMTPAEFETIRRGDFGERDPRADKAMTQRFLPQMGAPAAPMPPPSGDSFASLPSSILEGLKDALKVTFAEAKSLTEQAFYAPKYLGAITSSAAMGGLGFVGQKIEEANKATADAMGGVGTAFPGGVPIGLPAAVERLRQVAGRPGNYRALIDYMNATGVPFRAVSTVRPGATTRGSGGARASLHASGRAVDFAGLRPSRDSPELLRIYRAFEPVRGILQELIYSGPGGGFVRNPITAADHHDHVHAGLANGAYVRSRMTAMLGEAGPEVVIPLTRPMRALQLAEQSGLLGVLSQAAGQRAATQGDTGAIPVGAGAAGSVEVQGLFPGQGNTYNIYGISMAQVIAEIEAREQASTRVNFTRR
jgi:phage-related protein